MNLYSGLNKQVLFSAGFCLLLTLPLAVSAQSSQSMESLGSSSSMSLENEKSTQTKKWSLTLGAESWMMVQDRKTLGSDAPFYSWDYLGAAYKADSTWAFEVRQYAEYFSNRENLSGNDAVNHQNEFEIDSTAFLAKWTTGWTLASSKPLAIDFRYYTPNSRLSKLNHERGVLRSDISTEWMLDSHWSIVGLVSNRAYLNSDQNPDQVIGSDTVYQMKAGPTVNYYVTENFVPYYTYLFNVKSSALGRAGKLNIDPAHNTSIHEVGFSYQMGPVLLNPALTCELSNATAAASLNPQETRIFSAENNSYTLNVYAEF